MSSDSNDLRTIKVAITGEEAGEDRVESSPDELVGSRYKIVRRIGKGGMGEVMAACDVQIARDVAIKRMRAAHPSDKAIQRFLREAMVQGRLEHPAIVPVHEIGRDADGLPYFVMKKLGHGHAVRGIRDLRPPAWRNDPGRRAVYGRTRDRSRAAAAPQHLHLQAWQLRQLVAR
jgi:hypothetical protein